MKTSNIIRSSSGSSSKEASIIDTDVNDVVVVVSCKSAINQSGRALPKRKKRGMEMKSMTATIDVQLNNQGEGRTKGCYRDSDIMYVI